MFKNLAKAIGGDPQKRELDRMSVIVEQVNAFEAEYGTLPDDGLRAKTDAFRQRLADGETLDDILPEAFAAVREASKRTTGLRHYDIQLIGGMVLHKGTIAEMRTGEGKTLVATLPLYLNALEGKGAHLVTVNDYLARRDARWMAPIYNLLGLSVGVLQMSGRTDNARNAFLIDLELRDGREENDQLRTVLRKEAYAADITYGTNNEFGFDYLRDNLVMDISSRVQREHHYAIVDEVDNILIDEARTPLIISGPASEEVEWYSRMAVIVRQLDPADYDFDEKDRSIALTEIGEAHVEDLLKIPLRDPDRPEDITPEQARLLGYLEQALRSQLLYTRNKDYIVQNGQVIIVDEFTGRLMPGRRWSEGLHQAVEAKEGVKVNPENITHATITLQNYFRKYKKLAGMTGTAVTEAEELSTIYKLDVIEIPTNLDFESAKPTTKLITLQTKDEEGYSYTFYTNQDDPEKTALFWKRKDYPDVVYRTEEGKLRAIVLEILKLHVTGRPQLVGTTSIEHSERLSTRLHAEPLRRLLSVNLIRDAYMKANNINIIERAIPDLEFMNKPLAELKVDELRKFAQGIGLSSVNPESPENLATIAGLLELKESDLERLKEAVIGGIGHQVLNALKHDQESQIITGAGAFGAVTIATNMAGRGVDIKLGGEIHETIIADVRKALAAAGRNPYGMTQSEMAAALVEIGPDAYPPFEESIQTFQTFLNDMKRVREVGGLHVVGSERHEARRIDNQLRGRAARQGDPGSSRFFLSLEDDLMRMFGGERAETMMRLFNIDPSIPLESKMLGRLVEQAQERVEGYNFDIRKHLLDYDDVLNNQRERIYKERDRVLVKEDMEEDVLEMLRSELKRRIPEALNDPEGPWKLLAYLDEIQPTIIFGSQSERVISFTLLTIAGLLDELCGGDKDRTSIQTAALELARQTLEAEHAHLVSQTEAFVQRTAESYNTQLAERMDLLDIFLDNLNDQEPMNARELSTELQNQVRLKISLTGETTTALQNGSREAREVIGAEIENQLTSLFLSRMVMTLERRINSRLTIDSSTLADADWTTIENAILDAIDQVYAARTSGLNQAGSQILNNIESILKHQDEGGITEYDLIDLAAGMSVGTQAVIDARTHQRVNRKVSLLNYVFLAAKALEGKETDDISADVLTHLEDIQKQLQPIWGKMELQRLAQANKSDSLLEWDYLEKLSPDLNTEELSSLSQWSYQQIMDQNDPRFLGAFGKRVQSVIYRHILLRSISELWIEHLTQMEALRVSIGMEAYAQRDPLVMYKSKSTDTFKDLFASIRLGVISQMFRLQPSRPQVIEPQALPQALPAASQNAKPAEEGKKRKRHKKH
jgi:preprotein translocase subunit SecA